MDSADNVYSTQKISPDLISQIVDALRNKAYGSVEIYVENYAVTQITERSIKKLARHFPKKRFSIKVMRNGNSVAVGESVGQT